MTNASRTSLAAECKALIQATQFEITRLMRGSYIPGPLDVALRENFEAAFASYLAALDGAAEPLAQSAAEMAEAIRRLNGEVESLWRERKHASALRRGHSAVECVNYARAGEVRAAILAAGGNENSAEDIRKALDECAPRISVSSSADGVQARSGSTLSFDPIDQPRNETQPAEKAA